MATEWALVVGGSFPEASSAQDREPLCGPPRRGLDIGGAATHHQRCTRVRPPCVARRRPAPASPPAVPCRRCSRFPPLAGAHARATATRPRPRGRARPPRRRDRPSRRSPPGRCGWGCGRPPRTAAARRGGGRPRGFPTGGVDAGAAAAGGGGGIAAAAATRSRGGGPRRARGRLAAHRGAAAPPTRHAPRRQRRRACARRPRSTTPLPLLAAPGLAVLPPPASTAVPWTRPAGRHRRPPAHGCRTSTMGRRRGRASPPAWPRFAPVPSATRRCRRSTRWASRSARRSSASASPPPPPSRRSLSRTTGRGRVSVAAIAVLCACTRSRRGTSTPRRWCFGMPYQRALRWHFPLVAAALVAACMAPVG